MSDHEDDFSCGGCLIALIFSLGFWVTLAKLLSRLPEWINH
jgi:hypothetical protein